MPKLLRCRYSGGLRCMGWRICVARVLRAFAFNYLSKAESLRQACSAKVSLVPVPLSLLYLTVPPR